MTTNARTIPDTDGPGPAAAGMDCQRRLRVQGQRFAFAQLRAGNED